MSKSFSKPIIILIAVMSAIIISSCATAEQYAFFVTLGDKEAQTQTLEEARDEWKIEEATVEQKAVLKHLHEEEQKRLFLIAVREHQERMFLEALAEQNRRPTDCISAMRQIFPASAHAWGHKVIMRESGNNPSAQNPSSTAAGCWQMLRMHDHRYYSVGCTPAQKYDALCNTKAAYTLYQAAGTRPWVLTSY